MAAATATAASPLLSCSWCPPPVTIATWPWASEPTTTTFSVSRTQLETSSLAGSTPKAAVVASMITCWPQAPALPAATALKVARINPK